MRFKEYRAAHKKVYEDVDVSLDAATKGASHEHPEWGRVPEPEATEKDVDIQRDAERKQKRRGE